MVDYEPMYAILCGAIDDVLEDLKAIPAAAASAAKLQNALLDAEEHYLSAEDDKKA